MKTQRTLVELCAGTGAITFALHGMKPPVSMIGSKRTLSKHIIQLLNIKKSEIDNCVLVDLSEWSNTNRVILEQQRALDVADVFQQWLPEDAKYLFDRLRGSPPSNNEIIRAAIHLFLQTRTYRGKEVYALEDKWITHGFDPEYRAAKTPESKDRGWYNSRESLISKLIKIQKTDWLDINVVEQDVYDVLPIKNSVVIFDPPYASREPYRFNVNRIQVLEIAKKWSDSNCSVFVCEGEPLEDLIKIGWKAVKLPTRKGGTQLSKCGHEEWITYKS